MQLPQGRLLSVHHGASAAENVFTPKLNYGHVTAHVHQSAAVMRHEQTHFSDTNLAGWTANMAVAHHRNAGTACTSGRCAFTAFTPLHPAPSRRQKSVIRINVPHHARRDRVGASVCHAAASEGEQWKGFLVQVQGHVKSSAPRTSAPAHRRSGVQGSVWRLEGGRKRSAGGAGVPRRPQCGCSRHAMTNTEWSWQRADGVLTWDPQAVQATRHLVLPAAPVHGCACPDPGVAHALCSAAPGHRPSPGERQRAGGPGAAQRRAERRGRGGRRRLRRVALPHPHLRHAHQALPAAALGRRRARRPRPHVHPGQPLMHMAPARVQG